MVEAAGVEPASENASERTSTRVGTLFRVSRSPAAAGLRAQRVDYVSTSMRRRVRRSSLIVAVLRGYRRKLRAPSLPGFNQAARATALSFAVAGLPIFTWPWAPRRAVRTSTSPSKPVRPLVKEQGHYGVARGGGQAEDFVEEMADLDRRIRAGRWYGDGLATGALDRGGDGIDRVRARRRECRDR